MTLVDRMDAERAHRIAAKAVTERERERHKAKALRAILVLAKGRIPCCLDMKRCDGSHYSDGPSPQLCCQIRRILRETTSENPKTEREGQDDEQRRSAPRIGGEMIDLKCHGTGRDKDCVSALCFYFNRRVTDDELRYFDEVMKRAAHLAPLAAHSAVQEKKP